jgi:hypothetical protein
METNTLDRELKRGSTEMLILALVEDRPRHGYEIAKLIEQPNGAAGLPGSSLRAPSPAASFRQPDMGNRCVQRDARAG